MQGRVEHIEALKHFLGCFLTDLLCGRLLLGEQPLEIFQQVADRMDFVVSLITLTSLKGSLDMPPHCLQLGHACGQSRRMGVLVVVVVVIMIVVRLGMRVIVMLFMLFMLVMLGMVIVIVMPNGDRPSGGRG